MTVAVVVVAQIALLQPLASTVLSCFEARKAVSPQPASLGLAAETDRWALRRMSGNASRHSCVAVLVFSFPSRFLMRRPLLRRQGADYVIHWRA